MPARADQHHRLDVRILVALGDGFKNAFRHARAQRIHRRIVHGDHADAVFDFKSHKLSAHDVFLAVAAGKIAGAG